MTEAEWLVCDDAREMHECLRRQFNVRRRKAGRRKLRLFGCACCRIPGPGIEILTGFDALNKYRSRIR